MKSVQSKITVSALTLPAAQLIQIKCQDSDGLLIHVWNQSMSIDRIPDQDINIVTDNY